MKNIVFLIAFSFTFNGFSQSFDWVKHVGSINQDISYAIVLDLEGNSYTTGGFTGNADFDPSEADYQLESEGAFDIYVLKLDPEGNFIWAKSIGGDANEAGLAIEIDRDGNIIVVGDFQGTVNFDPEGGTSSFSSEGQTDMFILKLTPAGDFIWAKSIGGDGADDFHDVACDNVGRILLTGGFEETVDFDPNASIFEHTSNGEGDIFVLQLSSEGDFIWAKQMGREFDDRGNGIAVDGWGSVYITGSYFQETVDFDPGAETFLLGNNGEQDAFVLKLDFNGEFLWAKRIGSEGDDRGESIEIDPAGNVYVAGNFAIDVDFDPTAGGVDMLSAESTDIFLLKLNADGTYKWAEKFGGLGWDYATGLDIDTYGFPYVTGIDPQSLGQVWPHNLIMQKFGVDGDIIWVERIGDAGAVETAYGVAVDAYSNVYVTGSFDNEVDFDPSFVGVFNLSPYGTFDKEDGFILKLKAEEDVAVSENQLAEYLVYPNPTTGLVHFKLDQNQKIIALKVFDFSGKIVLEKYDVNESIDFSKIANGNYSIQLELDSGEMHNERLVVSK